jgi:hypothetical protein
MLACSSVTRQSLSLELRDRTGAIPPPSFAAAWMLTVVITTAEMLRKLATEQEKPGTGRKEENKPGNRTNVTRLNSHTLNPCSRYHFSAPG